MKRRGRSSTPLSTSAVEDAEERAWIRPRVAQLLSLEARSDLEQAELFAGWRLFFERLAERDPVVLVFEDMQWADAPLLEFVAYLLEWSRSHAILVVALARPGSADAKAQWAAGLRNATTLSVEPLSTEAMEALLDGFVPGLPDDLRTQILERSEGVPLYAVETVRMLIDRGLLEQVGDEYRPTGPIEALEVPETLQALIAARLDGLPAEERSVVQDAAVLGKTFSKSALAAVSGSGDSDLDTLLAALVRKEVLSLQVDPRSPERGQFSFLQDLLRQVAYETLSRRERKGEASGGGRSPRAAMAGRRRGARRDRCRPCPLGSRARPRGGRRRRAPETSRGPPRPCGRTRCVAGRERERPAVHRAGARALRESSAPRRAPRAGWGAGPSSRAALTARAPTSSRRSPSSRSSSSRIPLRA